MPITVKTYTSNQVLEYKERKYLQFLDYYKKTNLGVEDIFRAIGLTNNRNATVKYIRTRLKREGYNSLTRAGLIKKGEWV